MRIGDALEKLYSDPSVEGLVAPDGEYLLVYDPTWDDRGLLVFWSKKKIAEIPDPEQLIAGFGDGITMFSVKEILSDDWRFMSIREAARTFDLRGHVFERRRTSSKLH